ncbi:MAG: stage III sporulation protein AB [Moorellales bacterium]
MKLLGALMVFWACGALGMLLAGNLVRRQQILRELQVALQLLETEITYAATPLPEAFRRVGQKCRSPVGRLFLAAANTLDADPGITAGEAWEAGLAALWAVAPMDREEVAVLSDLGQGLGRGDREDQRKKLELARAQLQHLERTAAEVRARQTRVWQTLGFLGGVTIILLLYW